MAPVNKLGEIPHRASLVMQPENMPPDHRVIARHDCISIILYYIVLSNNL